MSHCDRHLCPECLEEEFDTYKHSRIHELMEINDEWRRAFGIDKYSRWGYELESSTLTFSEDGDPKVIANIEVVGTVHGEEWEWAWGNGTLPEQCRGKIGIVRELGQQKKWEKLTSLFLKSDEYLGWELTAISAHLLNAKGAYRCPDSDLPGDFMYVVILQTWFVN